MDEQNAMNKYAILTGFAAVISISYCWLRLTGIAMEEFEKRLVGK